MNTTTKTECRQELETMIDELESIVNEVHAKRQALKQEMMSYEANAAQEARRPVNRLTRWVNAGTLRYILICAIIGSLIAFPLNAAIMAVVRALVTP